MTPWHRFRLLNLRHLRAHPVRTLLSVSVIAVAGALIVSLFAAYGSLSGSVERFSEDVAGDAALEISGVTDTGFDQDLLAQASNTPGVAVAVPIVRSPVTIGGHDLMMLGVDQRSTALRSTLRRVLNALPARTRLEITTAVRAKEDGIVAGPGITKAARLSSGQRISILEPRGGMHKTQVITTTRATEDFNGGYWAITSLQVAQRITGRPGTYDSILIVTKPGISESALRETLNERIGGRAIVARPQLRSAQANQTTGLLKNTTLIVALMALVAAGFLVFTTASRSAMERRQALATLRTLGGSRRILLAGYSAESLLTGLAGALIGIPAGILLGHLTVDFLPPVVTSGFDVRVTYVLPSFTIPLVLTACVGVSLLSSWLATRQAFALEPIEALQQRDAAAPDRGRFALRATAAGLFCLLLGIVALAARDQRSLVAAPLFLIGLLLLALPACGWLTRMTAALARRLGGPGRLAAVAVERAPRRVLATSVTLGITLGIGVATVGGSRNVVDVVDLGSLRATDLWVSPTPPDVLPVSPLLPRDLAARVSAVPGVATVTRGQLAYATFGGKRVVVAGVTGGNAPIFRLANDRARAAVLAGSATVISRGVARTYDLDVGDLMTLSTPGGPQKLPVADIIDYVTLETGSVAVSLDQFQQWYRRTGDGWLEVGLAPGADRGAVRRQLEGVAKAYDRPIHVVTGEEELRTGRAAVAQATSLAMSIQLIVTGLAGLALTNTLMASIAERRRELGILRAIGASRRLIRRMVLAEAAAVGVTGCVLGLIMGIPMQYLATQGLANSMASDIPFTVEPVAIGLTAAAFVLGLLAAVPPARHAGRLNVLSAIGYE